jgi:1-deoxy-D-xylulose-5-phosphate synthase
MWDMSICGLIPGVHVAAPRDAATLREELREAVEISDGPSVVRYPKASVGDDLPALERVGTVDVLHRPAEGENHDVLLVPVGAFGELGVAAAQRLADQGIGVTVVDPRWVFPIAPELVEMAAGHKLVVTVEDGGRHGGFGWTLASALRDADVEVPLRDLGVPQEFHQHAERGEVLASLGLTAQGVARRVTEWVAGRMVETAQASEMDAAAEK